MTTEYQAPAVVLLSGDASERPRWIQIAYEGEWKGHHQGPFKLSRADFNKIVENFRAHPAYRAGGAADVVPFDFDHASEMPATLSSVAREGKPAQGWAREVEVRSSRDGKAELWALSRVLEPARTYLREGKMRWVSAAICFSSNDFVTGKPCGPSLTSIAFTNQPFLRALPALAASARPNPGVINMPRSVHLLAALNLAVDANDEAVEQATIKLSQRVRDLETENASLKKRQAEEDVDAAISTYGLSAHAEILRPTLLAARIADPDGFAKQYPVVAPSMRALTQRTIDAAPPAARVSRLTGPQPSSPFLRGLGDGGRMLSAGPGVSQVATDDEAHKFVRTLAAHPGRNKTERAMSYVRSLSPAAKDLSHEDCHAQACLVLAQNGVPADVIDVTDLLG